MYIGTDRAHSKLVALVLMGVGIILAPDIIIPTGTDILNFLIAAPIADFFGVTYTEALMGTFIFAFLLIATGLLIFPYNTKRLLIGRIRMGVAFATSHIFLLIASIIILFVFWMLGQAFYETIYQYAKEGAIMFLNGGV